MTDKNCLSYWFPKLESAGIPVPKTEILTIPEEARAAIWELFDGKKIDMSPINQFAADIEAAAKRIAGPDKKYYPYFIRTGQTSHKHAWEKTCWCSRDSDIPSHIVALAEFSECADMLGLPWHTWAVREMLPTKPITILGRYGGFPLVPEVRCFIKAGEILCSHPYWPTEAVFKGGCDSPLIAGLAQDMSGDWRPLAQQAAEAFADDEAFSVDILPTERGWYVTDMALARRSYHWDGCPVEFK